MNTLPNQRLLDRIRAEYLEMPGMKLTIAQVGRLCGVERLMCQSALDSLIQAQFLLNRADGTYVRMAESGAPTPRPAKTALASTPSTALTRRAS